jgi:hypothetical protein
MVRQGGPQATPKEGLYDAENVYLDDSGALILRPGKKRFETRPIGDPATNLRIAGLHVTYQKTAATESPRVILVGEQDNGFGSITGKIVAWKAGQRGPFGPVWSEIATGLRLGRFSTATTMQEHVVIGHSRVDPPLYWNSRLSSPARHLSRAPNGQIVANYLGRLVIAGDARDPSLVHVSAADGWDNFDIEGGAESFEVGSGDGDRIVALDTSFFGQMIVFKRRSIHRITGTTDIGGADPFRRSPISDRLGTLGSSTLVRVGNDIIFLTERGVSALSTTERFGDIETVDISSPIADYFRNIPLDELELARAVYDPTLGLVYFMMPRQTLVFEPARKAWYVWDLGARAAASCFLDSMGTIIFGYDDDGYVFSLEQEKAWDDGVLGGSVFAAVPIPFKISTGDLDAGIRMEKKQFRLFRLVFQATTSLEISMGHTVERDVYVTIANVRTSYDKVISLNPYDKPTYGDAFSGAYWWGPDSDKAGQAQEIYKIGTVCRLFMHSSGGMIVPVRILGYELEWMRYGQTQIGPGPLAQLLPH